MERNITEPADFSKLVNSVFDSIKIVDAEHSVRVLTLWQEVTESLYGRGSFLSSHSRIIEMNNGTLLVEADHSGCITLLQMYKRTIIKALKKRAPELEIKNMVYRLKGSDATLFKVQKVSPPVEAIIAEIKRRQEAEDAALEIVNKKDKMPKNFEEMIALPEFQKKLEQEEVSLENFRRNEEKSKKQKGYLPPDLISKFKELEDTVLTNSKNK